MNLEGLSDKEVAERIKQGRVNKSLKKNPNSVGKIIARNTLTIFNFVNLVLALMVLFVGSYKNLLFISIAIFNTLISIVNEIRAKKTVDKMRFLSEKKPTVIRNGKHIQIPADNIVDGDLIVFSLGDQIIVDSKIISGDIEVNESFITGESNNVTKHPGDKLLSGSFVVSGTCKAVVTAVGAENFIGKLQSSAYDIKTANSKLFTIMNNIVKYISFALIPIGALLLWARFRVPGTTTEVAVTSTVAALINMIPEGLILLTSSVLALATIRLSRKKVLVQDLYSIETLARVDCICLDKTGTITTGRMKVKDLIPAKGKSKKALENALMTILSTATTENATSVALKEKLLKTAKFEPTEQILEIIPFSSDRKYSGVVTKKATYLMGAPEFLLDKAPDFPGNYRVLAVVRCDNSTGGRAWGTPSRATARMGENARTGPVELLGCVLLEDEIRKDAKKIIDFFKENDVAIKIISGDNLSTVTNIAVAVGVPNPVAVDLSTLKSPISYDKLVQEYNIFTRVKPAQKKSLILALKKQGQTVAMTGDGVNDILAMKEADCSIAIGEGSDAARRSAKLVLLSSDFAVVPDIIAEGRQSINNLERSTTLFLSKTIYASILAVLFTVLPLEYPYTPIEMTLLNFLCIGLPGLALALETNTARIKDQFVKNIKKFSVPTGLFVAFSMVILSVVAELNNFPRPSLITASAIITFVIDIVLIYRISRPLNAFRTALICLIVALFVIVTLLPITKVLFDFAVF